MHENDRRAIKDLSVVCLAVVLLSMAFVLSAIFVAILILPLINAVKGFFGL